MPYQFNGWCGLGSALRDANEEWKTELMPEPIALTAEELARRYGVTVHAREFEEMMEELLMHAIPDITEDEMHAAKHCIGKIFAENRQARRIEVAQQDRRFSEALQDLDRRTGM